ncbi:MAG: hypothetical protein ACKO3N_04965, partial [Verrucomicrobiota bacterium]
TGTAGADPGWDRLTVLTNVTITATSANPWKVKLLSPPIISERLSLNPETREKLDKLGFFLETTACPVFIHSSDHGVKTRTGSAESPYLELGDMSFIWISP